MTEYKNELFKLIKDYITETLPSVSLDLAIFGFHDGQMKVLLLRWLNTDHWCLPGGRIRQNEDLETAAYRSLQERTGLHELFLQQFYTFGDIARYIHYSHEETMAKLELPEWFTQDVDLGRRDVSVGYYALVEYTKANPTPDLFTEECRWWNIDEVPLLLFDHNKMIQVALKTLRRQLSYQPIGYNLLPDKFTMPQLQQLYETILGQSMDRRNFQKRMLSYGILERLEKLQGGGAHKAPYLYRFDVERYQKALEEERMFLF
jgi:8-oxo-dGTP diphosphatase